MSKNLKNFIIGIGIASILFAIYGVIKGGDFVDALGGIIIGASLIGSIIYENSKTKNNT